jgi:putative flippase GtrA
VSERDLLPTLSRFAVVGLSATLVYFLVASSLMLLGIVRPTTASIVGYVAGMSVSFVAQGRVTFLVDKLSSTHASRFIVLSLIGLSISYLSVRAVAWIGGAPIWGVPLTCFLVPALSFVVMRFWVFK